MSKPNWACSSCGMYSSRRWSVERHILNLHDGISNVVPFVDYLVGRKSGFYLPKFRPAFVKKNATKTVTVMDTFKDELLKGFASKAVNKALSSSPMQNHQFGTNGAPYFYPSQSYFEPLRIIPRPEDVFGFEIYVCKKCSSIEPIIVSFSDGQEGGSKSNRRLCCNSSDLKRPDQNSLSDNQLQVIKDKLKYCVKAWTNGTNYLTTIKIPDQMPSGNSIRLVKEIKKSITLEYLPEKCIELEANNEEYWALRAIKAKQIILNDDELVDFLNKVRYASFGMFKVKTHLYLMAINK